MLIAFNIERFGIPFSEIWHPSINDILIARPQPEKPKDRFAVVVMIEEKEVGHLPIGKSG